MKKSIIDFISSVNMSVIPAFLEFVILQSCFMFLHRWEDYNFNCSYQNIPCIQQRPIETPTTLMECCSLSPCNIFDHCLRWHRSAPSMPFLLYFFKRLSIWYKVGCGRDETEGCSGIPPEVLHCSKSTGR